MRLDLRLLEIFCRVYEAQSFSRAAERLYLSQPTVSGHIRNLEEQLGVSLFDRLPRNIVPTPAAHLLYRHGRTILRERDLAVQDLGRLLNKVGGKLTLCASTTPGEYLLPSLLAEFRRRFPAVHLEVKISDSLDVCRQLLQGDVELGFTGARLEDAVLAYRRFAQDELILVAGADSPWAELTSCSLEQLSRLPLLVREPGSGTRRVFERQLGRSLEEFNIVAVLSSANAVKEALKARLGVSVVSSLSVRSEMETGLLRSIAIPELGPVCREFYAVTNERLTLSPLAQGFLDLVAGVEEGAGALAVREAR